MRESSSQTKTAVYAKVAESENQEASVSLTLMFVAFFVGCTGWYALEAAWRLLAIDGS